MLYLFPKNMMCRFAIRPSPVEKDNIHLEILVTDMNNQNFVLSFAAKDIEMFEKMLNKMKEHRDVLRKRKFFTKTDLKKMFEYGILEQKNDTGYVG